MLDIDRFKSINDRYGHDAGDLAICAASDVIRQTMRETDVCGRWGGEEFIVLAQHTDLDGARIVAERVREAIEDVALPEPLHNHQLTVSIGVAVMHGDDRAQLLRDADAALYAAKANGRNRLELAGEPALSAVTF